MQIIHNICGISADTQFEFQKTSLELTEKLDKNKSQDGNHFECESIFRQLILFFFFCFLSYIFHFFLFSSNFIFFFLSIKIFIIYRRNFELLLLEQQDFNLTISRLTTLDSIFAEYHVTFNFQDVRCQYCASIFFIGMVFYNISIWMQLLYGNYSVRITNINIILKSMNLTKFCVQKLLYFIL